MPHASPLRPTILISTASHRRNDGLYRQDSVTGLNYSQAIVEAGGLPLLVANLAPALAEATLERADALLLSGGADVDPDLFDAPPHPQLGHVDPQRDAFELALYHAARAAGKPVLGVCRGIQVINVAEGGSLHQHLPAVAHTIQHEQADRSGAPLHPIALEPDSYLARAFGRSGVKVNSFHHQAIDRLGRGLRITARTSDGVVEAVEGTRGAFLLGVQWHPEMSFQAYEEQMAPFTVFLEGVKRSRGVVGGVAV